MTKTAMALTAPVKPTVQTVPFKLLIACVTVAPLLVIAYTWLAEQALTPEYAKLFCAPLYAIWGTVGSVAGIGSVVGAVKHTAGKIETQKALEVLAATPAPPAGATFADADGDGLPDSEGDGPQDDEAPGVAQDIPWGVRPNG